MGKLIDRTGRKYGRLTVLSFQGMIGKGHSLWLCVCECGEHKVVRATNLDSGHTTSCGCMKVVGVTKHGRLRCKNGHTRSKMYIAWSGIKTRCLNPSSANYKNYGGRGITICDRWAESFENFLEDMGERPDGFTLDRINNSLGYYKENCQWATLEQQRNNTRRNKIVTFNGEKMTMSQLSKMSGVPYELLRQRIVKRKWSIEDSVYTPKKG